MSIAITVECSEGHYGEFHTEDYADYEPSAPTEDVNAAMSDAWDWARKHTHDPRSEAES